MFVEVAKVANWLILEKIKIIYVRVVFDARSELVQTFTRASTFSL